MNSIEIHGARKAFDSTPVLDSVDLTIPSGSTTAILGRSGSGKTTLLRCVAGFERLDAGSISIGGRMVDDGRLVIHAQRRGIGYVPQEGALFPHLRVAANIGFGLARHARPTRTAELIEMLGLQNLERRFPHQLSGGQRQRVALARALAPDPGVVLLDEPFSSLDAQLRTTMRTELGQVLRALGSTAIIVTHDQDEALAMADQVALLRHGRIHAVGAPRDLYQEPPDAITAGFLGDTNVLPVTVHRGQVSRVLAGVGPSSLMPDGDYDHLLRPEQIAASLQPIENSTRGVVVSVDYRGATSAVTIRLAGAAIELTITAAGSTRFVSGDTVWMLAIEPGVSVPR